MNAEKILADLQKSFAATLDRFRKPKEKTVEKTVQILKQKKTEQTDKKEYTGPSWYPEEKIYQLQKQAEAEVLEAALNSLTDSEMVQVVKAVSKQSPTNSDYWYKPQIGIFV